MPSFSPKPSGNTFTSNQAPIPQQRFFEHPRLPEKKEGYQVGIPSSITGSRSRVSVVDSSPGTFSTTTQSASLDGAGNLSITNAAQTGLNITGDITIEMWLKCTNLADGNTRVVLSKLDSAGGYQVDLRDPSGAGNQTFHFLHRSGTGNAGIGTNTVTLHSAAGTNAFFFSPTTHNHAAIVFNSGAGTGTVTFYGNGVQNFVSPTSIGSINTSTADFALASNSTGGSLMAGVLKEVRVWNTARSGSQIVEDMRNDSPSGSGLVGYWKLGGDSLDSSGNANHLTAGASVTYGTDLPFGTVYGVTKRFFTNTGGDGHARVQNEPDFGTARGTAAADSVTNDASYGTTLVARTNFPTQYAINRTFMPFDTSSLLLPARSSQLLLRRGATTATGTLCLVKTTQADTGTLVVGDYSAVTVDSPLEGASRLTSLNGTGVWQWWELNSTGLGFVGYGGNTLLGIRQSRDVDNVPPSGATSDLVDFAMSEFNGTIGGPILDIIV